MIIVLVLEGVGGEPDRELQAEVCALVGCLLHHPAGTGVLALYHRDWQPS